MPPWCHTGAMDLTQYVEHLRNDLAVTAAAGGEEAREVAERLTAPLDAAVRLMLLDALSAAADEITRELAPGSVELRLRSGEPGFVVTPAPADDAAGPAFDAAAPAPPDVDDAPTALRIGLVHEVAEDLDGAVESVVDELLSAGPQAARWAKRLVRERPDGPETARWIAERRTSDEGQEGLRAFLEKRKPSWKN